MLRFDEKSISNSYILKTSEKTYIFITKRSLMLPKHFLCHSSLNTLQEEMTCGQVMNKANLHADLAKKVLKRWKNYQFIGQKQDTKENINNSQLFIYLLLIVW